MAGQAGCNSQDLTPRGDGDGCAAAKPRKEPRPPPALSNMLVLWGREHKHMQTPIAWPGALDCECAVLTMQLGCGKCPCMILFQSQSRVLTCVACSAYFATRPNVR